jgi:hypothetical protein
MTLQAMLEMIRQVFPEKQEAQVRMDLNNAYRMYCEETRLPIDDFDVTVSGGTLAISGASLTVKDGWYVLPSPVKDIITITAYDAQDKTVERPEYIIGFLGRQFNIMDIMYDTLLVGGSLPSGVTRIRFRCSITPAPLASDSDVPDLPEQFHEALVDHVLTKYFAIKGILQQSGWFRSSYQALVTAGKRYFNRNI